MSKKTINTKTKSKPIKKKVVLSKKSVSGPKKAKVKKVNKVVKKVKVVSPKKLKVKKVNKVVKKAKVSQKIKSSKKSKSIKSPKSASKLLKKKEIKVKGKKVSEVEVFPPSEEKIVKVIEKGKLRGFLTETEILYLFPCIESYIYDYEIFLNRLTDAGVKVLEDSGNLLDGKEYFTRKSEIFFSA